MKLTKAERWILINQCEMLRLMKSDRWQPQEWARCITILQNGYEDWYDECLEQVAEPLPKDTCQLVYDTLEIYQAIEAYKRTHPEDKEIAKRHDATFPGFDGNSECEYMGFAVFLIDTMGRYREVAKGRKGDDYNSTVPMVPKYRNMSSIWNSSEHLMGVLSRAQVLRLLGVPSR
jgi:uncharacterized protein YfbU (UPF0304 family)